MWKLTKPLGTLTEWYVKEMCDNLCNHIKSKKDEQGNLLLDERIQNILVPNLPDGKPDLSVLRKLLTYEPKSLYKLCDSLMKKIITGYDDSEFNDYLKAKNRTLKEASLYKKYHDALNNLLNVFDYDGQISQNKRRAYKLTSEQGHNTCTYCNRQYVFTVLKDVLNNDSSRIARPELDHWFSKELYPLMSLSLYNLIPSCSICNKAKGNEIFGFDTHIHPYLDETPNEPKFKFRYTFNQKECCDDVIGVVIEGADNKEKNMISTFKLEEIYCYHGELEVKDILRYKYQNSDAYLDQLLRNVLEHYQISEEDVYRMFFGTELKAKNDLNRPLSKLKRDVLKQIGLLKDDRLEW